jgi:hypothetical protein
MEEIRANNSPITPENSESPNLSNIRYVNGNINPSVTRGILINNTRWYHRMILSRNIFSFLISLIIIIVVSSLLIIKTDQNIDGLYSSGIGILSTILGSYLTIFTRKIKNPDNDDDNE